MTHNPKHRHAVEGGYQRGEETRARIVLAAVKLFGERGFSGASTRDIAADAGVNAPALQYYFDNKEGVYLACVEHIASRVWEYMSEVILSAERALADNVEDEALIEVYCAIQAQLADFMYANRDKEDWRLFMARLQAGMGPAAGLQSVFQGCTRRITAVAAAIVGRLIGRAPDDEETLIRTLTLNGQVSMFHMSRQTTLTALKWDRIDAGRLALLKRLVLEQTRCVLTSLASARKSGRTLAHSAPPPAAAEDRGQQRPTARSGRAPRRSAPTGRSRPSAPRRKRAR